MSQLQDNSIPLSDEVIRAFLLGRLDTAEQKRFEEKLISDDELEARVRLAEFQLADDFVTERIDRVDSHRFEKNFLLTNERRRKLMVSTAMRDRFASAAEPAAKHLWGVTRFFGFHRLAWRFAFVVAIALLVLASVYLVTKEPQIVRRMLPKRAPSKPAAVSTPLEIHHPKDSAPPAHQDTVTPPPSHESTLPPVAAGGPIVATIVLHPGTPDAMPQSPAISVPADTNGIVRLELAAESNGSEEFTAELFTDSNQSVFVRDLLKKTDSGGLGFDVPVRVLKSGDYRIQLTRRADGSSQIVASYYFRVK